MAKPKTYINKCAIKEYKFPDGGSVLNCAFGVDELKEHADDYGWVNITIAERREPSDKGNTHYAYKDEFEPNKDSDRSSGSNDDMPF